ncbi:hypothetical protein [Pontiella sulfatireligans]|uniref:Uncharacterized protein n=1 Tax=Pontiella sulfatireligans TaxID=2750658 RepID=A0A6C2UR26_9BACT|nr:hypothetical protein [Pontiella sulfatireligans]VGO21744.1 hypothetical protein SCARR_03819 [Pontiella sulfatireligans]
MEFTPLDKRIWTKGLVLECPHGKALDDCPLNALRHLPANQVNRTINGLTDQQVDSIVTIHQHCYQERLAAAPTH